MAVETRSARRARPTTSRERESIWVRLPRPVSMLVLAGLICLAWQAAVELELLSQHVLPPPVDVATEFADVVGNVLTGGYARHELWITTQEVILAFLLAAAIGIAGGIVVAETAFGRHVLLPFLVGVNAAPKVAFAPLFVAWLGFGTAPKVVLGAFIAFFPLLIDTAAGLGSVDGEELKLFRSLRASRRQTLLKLKLPAALPFVFAGLKTASVLAVVGAIVGEFLGGGSGFGQLIKIAGSQLAMSRMFAFALVLSIAGYLFYALISFLERKIVFWRSAPDVSGGGH